MKKYTFFYALAIFLFGSLSELFSQQPLSYYLPQNITYNPSVPKPSDVLGYQVGEFHVSHDQLVSYFLQLAQVSARIKYEVYGRTHEGRPLTVAIISSEANIKRIDEIRKQHLQLSDPSISSNIDISNLPVVVWLSHSIHGNEASGTNSSLLTAYYFVAGTGKEIDEILDRTIILLDPATNPDGIHRFSTWANSNRSYQGNPDPLSREHNEAWPGGRTNHYWFDLNRDWLPLEQPESENRIKKLLEWKPNILVDLHEQGTNATFHFSPGEPSRVNPLISHENQELTQKLADHYAKAFDAIGSLYTSGERYDDYYIGRGPTFLDLNGGVALLFEQASARGFSQDSDNGLLTFPFAIRNQFTGAITTVKTASELKNEYLTYQKNYYLTAIEEAKKNASKAFVFGSGYDHTATYKLAKLLTAHGIKTYVLKKDVTSGKQLFKASAAYIVPFDQPQYRLIQSIFETRTIFADSIFYDISAWNLPLAYNLPYEAVSSYAGLTGDAFSIDQQPVGKRLGNGSAYAYIFKWEDFNSPRALYRLLEQNIIAKVTTEPFETKEGLKFDRGSVVIPLGTVNPDPAKVDSIVSQITKTDGIDIFQLSTGDNKIIDLGSQTFERLSLPKIAILSEEGVNALSAGSIWHLLDTKYKIPFSLLPLRALRTANLYKYNVIILPSGNYQSIDARTVEKLQAWLAAGNTLIAFENAATWLAENKLIQAEFKKDEAAPKNLDYKNAFIYKASREVPGTVFEARLDLSHPINYGFKKEKIALFKENDIIQEKAEENPLSYPIRFTKSPLLDGYVPIGFDKSLASTPAVGIFGVRRGKIIVFYNSITFRGYWLGTDRFLANGLFFGNLIRLSTGFDRE